MRWVARDVCVAVVLFATIILAGLAGAQTPALPWPTRFQSTVHADHPLVGAIYDVRAGSLLEREALVEALHAVPVRLIGEIHDNPDHHVLQGWLVGAVTQRTYRGRFSRLYRGIVVMEHLKSEQRPSLEGFAGLDLSERTPDRFFDEVGWDKSGWPSREIFRPLIDAVLAIRGHGIVPGDVARDKLRGVARGGIQTLSADEQARLGLAHDYSDAERDSLLAELEASHCGLMPKSALAGMAAAQRYRDAHLADAVRNAAADGSPTTLIAGNGHVRADRGVAWHLRRLAPDLTYRAVLIVEVEAGVTEPAAYLPTSVDSTPAADFIIFTPRVARDDPCVAMRRQFAPKPPAKP